MPHETAASKRHKVVVSFWVRSKHPNIETAVLLQNIEKTGPQLKKDLSARRKVSSISFKRRGTLPIGLESALITVVITLASEAGKEVAKKVAADAYGWLKNKWKDAQFRKLKAKRPAKRKTIRTKR